MPLDQQATWYGDSRQPVLSLLSLGKPVMCSGCVTVWLREPRGQPKVGLHQAYVGQWDSGALNVWSPVSHVHFEKWQCHMFLLLIFLNITCQIQEMSMSHVATFYTPCRMSLSPMSHVEYKFPCLPVDFRRQGPYSACIGSTRTHMLDRYRLPTRLIYSITPR